MLGLTQDEVAKKAGLTQSQIALLENNSQITRVDTLIKNSHCSRTEYQIE
jgi:transcriptional regulator with XRE-family HTH domain